ncbi:MAG TPA: glycerate kinase [Anaerolineales bacterium]|nr:glycerate kinase [Anaerolineales bacterium]
MDANRFATQSLQDARVLRILSAALDAVDPFKAVQKFLPQLDGNVHGLAIGKAAIPMMDALAARIPLTRGLAVTKFASGLSLNLYTVLEGGHPIPDARSFHAGEKVLEFVSSLNEDDTLVCLISGGGSALVTAPCEGITLDDIQTLTSLLLASGARIDEINTIRRAVDRVKGGGLVRATMARVISLILSDVIGNPLEAIASGPTNPNPTTNKDALAILRKYNIENQVSSSILHFVTSTNNPASKQEIASSRREAPLLAMTKTQNIIIGDNILASHAALEQANRDGFVAEILTNELQGEAHEVGVRLAKLLRDELSRRARPFCLIAGGETTVTLRGNGRGGRNQELALAAVDELRGLSNVLLIPLATDGDDGPTDAAGAVATGESVSRAESLGLSAADYLSRNDAYPFFEALGDLLKPGPTGTNVNDLIFLFAL